MGRAPFPTTCKGRSISSFASAQGGRHLCCRWHGDNPVTFNRYLKHTMEHGHANNRGDNFYSCCYWYQAEPYTDLPPLPPAADRIPVLRAMPGPRGVLPGDKKE